MTHARSQAIDWRQRTVLLDEVVALLMWEIEAVSSRNWSCLSKLKRKKTQLASRLRRFDWTQRGPDAKPVARLLARIDHYRRRLEVMKWGHVTAREVK